MNPGIIAIHTLREALVEKARTYRKLPAPDSAQWARYGALIDVITACDSVLNQMIEGELKSTQAFLQDEVEDALYDHHHPSMSSPCSADTDEDTIATVLPLRGRSVDTDSSGPDPSA